MKGVLACQSAGGGSLGRSVAVGVGNEAGSHRGMFHGVSRFTSATTGNASGTAVDVGHGRRIDARSRPTTSFRGVATKD